MSATLSHRGPDGSGLWLGEGIGLAHQRLAILDLSPQAHQPMLSQDGRFCLIYNGCLYNFRELREELKAEGCQFRSSGDSEVVLEALARWGMGCLSRFNGMFALALWNIQERQLHLARDRYGVKPLYYYERNQQLLFASEIKALLKHPSCSRRLSIPALHEYFSFQNIFSDGCLFAGVHLLPAGCRLSIKAGGAVQQIRYWDYHFQDDPKLGEQECQEELARLFKQAVQRQTVSDVEVGAYLSGGLDSGSITAVCAQEVPHLRSFTCGFDLSSASGLELNFDERVKAEAMSYRFRTEHYQVILKAGDMERVMPDLVYHLEDLRVGQCYPNYYVSRLASRFVKVVLSGTGGDELFAGYPWRYAASALGSQTQAEFIKRHYAYWQRLIPDEIRADFFRQRMDPGFSFEIFKGVFGEQLRERGARPEDHLNLSLYFESKTFLHGLLLMEDKISMSHGLEVRLPFLDNDLVEFAQRIPVRYKLRSLHPQRVDENDHRGKARSSEGKQILREVLRRFVPESITQAEKQGFSAPDGSWFKGDSMDYIRRLLFGREARLYDFLDRRRVQGLLEEHFQGRSNRRLFIWSCICFEWWLRIFEPQGLER